MNGLVYWPVEAKERKGKESEAKQSKIKSKSFIDFKIWWCKCRV